MVTRETIKAELDRVPDSRLSEVYEVVKCFSRSTPQIGGGSLMAKLRTIKIQGPQDFSENIDLYLTGEKQIPNGEVD